MNDANITKGEKTMIKIKTQKVLNDYGKPAHKIMGFKMLKENQLPKEYCKGNPYCYMYQSTISTFIAIIDGTTWYVYQDADDPPYYVSEGMYVINVQTGERPRMI